MSEQALLTLTHWVMIVAVAGLSVTRSHRTRLKLVPWLCIAYFVLGAIFVICYPATALPLLNSAGEIYTKLDQGVLLVNFIVFFYLHFMSTKDDGE